MKILNSRKALSPVVASIILVGVAVGVSLAFGGFMFGLFDTFKGEEVKILSISFVTGNRINVTLANVGTGATSIKYVLMNNGNASGSVRVWAASGASGDILGNSQLSIVFDYPWVTGTVYDFRVLTAKDTLLSQSQAAS